MELNLPISYLIVRCELNLQTIAQNQPYGMERDDDCQETFVKLQIL